MNESTSSMLVASTDRPTSNVSAFTPGTFLNVLTSTQEVRSNVTPSTRGTNVNGSSASWYDLDRNTSVQTYTQTGSGSQLDGVIPGICVGVAMVIFLSISFFHYHRRFRRKRNLAMEYESCALDAKRPRIAAPGCFTNLQQLNELGMFSAPQQQIEENGTIKGRLERGQMKLDDIPISVILHKPSRASTYEYTIPNPAFQLDDQSEDPVAVSSVDVDVDAHSKEGNQKLNNSPTIEPMLEDEVELRLSQLCSQCVDKVLSSSSRHQTYRPAQEVTTPVLRRASRTVDSVIGEYRCSTYDDCETMDAFHGRPKVRERRRKSMPIPLNRFGLKDNEFQNNSQSMKLCPYCFSGAWVTTRL